MQLHHLPDRQIQLLPSRATVEQTEPLHHGTMLVQPVLRLLALLGAPKLHIYVCLGRSCCGRCPCAADQGATRVAVLPRQLQQDGDQCRLWELWQDWLCCC